VTNKQAAWVGGILGLVAPLIVLTLFVLYGVWEVRLGNSNLTELLWPSSRLMIISWASSFKGITLKLVSVSLNCGLYIALALALRVGLVAAFKRLP
jgi:hypothetical protein